MYFFNNLNFIFIDYAYVFFKLWLLKALLISLLNHRSIKIKEKLIGLSITANTAGKLANSLSETQLFAFLSLIQWINSVKPIVTEYGLLSFFFIFYFKKIWALCLILKETLSGHKYFLLCKSGILRVYNCRNWFFESWGTLTCNKLFLKVLTLLHVQYWIKFMALVMSEEIYVISPKCSWV